ncbi:wax ester/triacylglycerol synthase domain-containing protein [Gordonia insulae]|uniref:diacylglycerol O-acyltransferase n=1 Tax=Gordonia insulae TaxID=2420509 RepID=A0A3G8JUP3_9ACTN|nr:wax ester/triacylglycerol synthase domain-containing protein [Gordonia insulae]AZG48455.1 putative diacylglycerol O-acyltransferase tgs3 [Gordonia insulae]
MVNRLSPRDAMYYFLDESGSTTHLGALLILDPHDLEKRAAARASRSKKATSAVDPGTAQGSSGTTSGATPVTLDYPRLVALVENRLQLVPRYRQVVREVTLGLARPVWVDDPDFDINFHIRRSGLPRPGETAQLQDLIARVMSRPLDRTRPLWEMYLIEGLPDGKLAILTKTHRCMVGGDWTLEISEVICDEVRAVEPLPEDLWMPGSPPGSTNLAIGALAEALSRPGDLVDSLVHGNSVIADLRTTAEVALRRVGGIVQQITDSAPSSRLNSSTTSTRIFAVASVPRRGCAKIADRYDCTVNDVELAIISGVMRRWMLSFDESVQSGDTVRVVLPLSARDPAIERRVDADGRWITVGKPSFVTDLPVGEDNPAVRLAQVAGLANRHAQSSRRLSMGPQPLLPELGVVPFPELSSRAFRSLNRRNYNVPVAMGTSPVAGRYVAGCPVAEMFAIPTLMAQRALAITITDYHNTLQFAFLADRGVISDLPAMTDYVTESYEELLATK